MATALLSLDLRTQEDVLLARRRARDLAALVQLTPAEQIGLSTAVWEVARLAVSEGNAELAVVDAPPALALEVTVSGVPGERLPGGGARPALDLEALRPLVGAVEVSEADGAATVRLSATPSPDAWLPGVDEVELVLRSLTRHDATEGPDILDELRAQNFELLTTLATLRDRERQLVRLNADLADTNRAVTALYTELEQQTEELRRRADTSARVLSTLTHELRTPLYAVRGMTEAILRDYPDLDDGVRDDVTLIDGAMVEALDLVNDHLDLAKVAAGRTTIRLSDVDVGELFATLRAIVSRLPIRGAVDLVFEDTAALPLPRPRTDGFKLSQILRNLIVNALKFTERGEVRVSARPTPDGLGLRFDVADTGIGMSQADQARAFEEFVQLGSDRPGELRGTGLGLPLTRRLAELLQGEVTVASELGRGSTFTVTIPLRLTDAGPSVEVIEAG